MWVAANRLLAARVAGQFGLVSRAQALGGGMSRKAIDCHLEAERWATTHPGVYLTIPGREGWDIRSMAALLWAGRESALMRESAGYAWGLLRSEPSLVEVVVPWDRKVRDTAGVHVSRSRYVRSRVDAVAWPHRIQAAHTVFDLARADDVDYVTTLAARALGLRCASIDELRAALEDRPRQPSRSLLTEILADVGSGSESAAERRYVRDVERRHGLPAGRRQAPVGDGRRRDVEYEEFGLIVEIDGRLNHAGWAAQRHDGVRDRGVVVSGRLAVRCYWSDLVPTACALAVDVGTILTARGWTGRIRPCGPACAVLRGNSVPSWGA